MNIDGLTLVSLFIGLSALGVAILQNRLTAQALHAQSYLDLEVYEENTKFRPGINIIADLPPGLDYDKFCNAVSPEDRQQIYDTVAYLGFVAHMVGEGFLKKRRAWGLYFHAYLLCADRLLGTDNWYLEGIRKDRGYDTPKYPEGVTLAYITFESMCLDVQRTSKSLQTMRRLEARGRKLPRI